MSLTKGTELLKSLCCWENLLWFCCYCGRSAGPWNW